MSQSESPFDWNGANAGPDYMAQSIARQKVSDNYVPTPMIEHTNCDDGNYPKEPTVQPSDSPEMPDEVQRWVNDCIANWFYENGPMRRTIRWLALDRERVMRERDDLKFAGAQLANIAYNLVQRREIDAGVLATTDACRKNWDDAARSRTSREAK